MLTRFIAVCLMVLAPVCTICAQTDAGLQARADKIKSNQRYYYGEGHGSTDAEAERIALDDLSRKVQMTVSGNIIGKSTENSETFEDRTQITSFVALQNTEKIVLGREPNASVLIYVLRSDVNEAMNDRADRVVDMVRSGLQQEKKLEIAGALKYYNWAYAMAKSQPRAIALNLDGVQAKDAKTWLNSHINAVMGSLQFDLDDVEERPGEVDPFIVNLNVTYQGQPVGGLDYNYQNGTIRVRDQHAKNGKASLAFEKLPTDNIDLQIDYQYADEARRFDPDLAAVYAAGSTPVFKKANLKVPVKGATPQKFEVKEMKLSKQEKAELTDAVAQTAVTVAPPRKRVAPVEVSADQASVLHQKLLRVKDALANHEYTSVKDLFTPDGYALFMQMARSGRLDVTKSNPDLRVESAGEYSLGRGIPLKITYKGGHSVTEELICRFNGDNLIESVAYALSKKAEDDIFRQNSWGLGARFAIRHFMEDYQTAFALKRLDFIESIFSDDAVIIRGKRTGTGKPKVTKGLDGQLFLQDPGQFSYKTQNKEDYLRDLRQQFPQKKYIQLTFEDNEIKEQPGVYNNIFWIELKQYYNSSNYSDVGFLTLMIDMRETQPQIKVRTWTPSMISLNELMNRYTQH